MVKALKLFALFSFLAAPTILWLGRPAADDCGHHLQNPCMAYGVAPRYWQEPLFVIAVGMGALLLAIAAVADHRREEDET